MASNGHNKKTIADCLMAGSEQLRNAGIDNSRLDVRLLLADAISKETSYLFGYPEKILSDEEFSCFQMMLDKRIKREPVSKIIGRKEFWSLNFKVTRDTLDPRPDSETLIEAVLENVTDKARQVQILGPWDRNGMSFAGPFE